MLSLRLLACLVPVLTDCNGPSSSIAAPTPARTVEVCNGEASSLCTQSSTQPEYSASMRASGSAGSASQSAPKARASEAASHASSVFAGDTEAGDTENVSTREAELTLEAARFERGDNQVPLWIPRDEELTYVVSVDLPIVGKIEAGKVVLSSGVERHVQRLPTAGASTANLVGERGWIQCTASGSAAGYVLEQELKTRLLPQAFPRFFYTDTQSGSENRRREVRIGVEDGKSKSEFHTDGHCKGCELDQHFVDSMWAWGKRHHCDGCKRLEHRIWRDPETRQVPKDTVDMLSAVYLARVLVRDEQTEMSFPLLDRDVLWNVRLSSGEHKRLKTHAGNYDCVEVRLDTKRPASEPAVKDGFEGLFGIRGQIHLWMEEKSGVPVLIQGELPVPVLGNLDVLVQLKRFKGTPKTFVAQK